MKKNALTLWQVQPWGIPPQANANLVDPMEDMLRGYPLPDDRHSPVVGMDEARQQGIGAVHAPLPLRSGRGQCEDDASERQGGCKQFRGCEPLRGGRHVRVPGRRTKRDWAECLRELVDVPSPHATRLRLGLDHLNTHTGASLYEALPPAAARRLRARLECHDTPKHARGLNMAAIDRGVLTSQGLDRRLDHAAWLRREISAWEERRHQQQVNIHWRLTLAVARHQLKKRDPVSENSHPPR